MRELTERIVLSAVMEKAHSFSTVFAWKFNSPNKTLVCCQSLSFSHFCSQSHTGSHCLCKGVTVSSGVPYCGYMLKVCVYFSCFVYQKSCYFFSVHVLLWCNPFMQSGIFVIIIMYFCLIAESAYIWLLVFTGTVHLWYLFLVEDQTKNFVREWVYCWNHWLIWQRQDFSIVEILIDLTKWGFFWVL